MNYSVIEALNSIASHKNQGVKSDRLIYLNSSKEQWCLIEYKSDTGETYEYLTNDLTLRPSVIYFLCHRRWDEEKYVDHYKNDITHSKAWGESTTAIKQQAIIGMITFVLTRLFSAR